MEHHSNPRPPWLEAECIARESYGKLVALLAAEFRDVAAAEDAVSEALVAALTHWPEQGIPNSPEGWLITVARHRFLDEARRTARQSKLLDALTSSELPQPFSIPDRRLALLFVCAHPAIDPAARAPLILQTVLGFGADRISQAFLVSPASMAQRLVRAKRKIRDAAVPFQIPERSEMPERLEPVLDALYACYTEGWSTPLEGVQRNDLTREAIWLSRLLVELCPESAEALGLLALVLYLDARSAARRSDLGDYIPLSEQDPALWNPDLLDEAESLLLHASRLGSPGRYQFEAAIQSAHIARRHSGQTDWASILAFYDALLQYAPNPVVLINRSVALAHVHGAAMALKSLAELEGDPRIGEYQPYWAAKANLHDQLGETQHAELAYTRAIGLASDPAVRRFLIERLGAGNKSFD
ncbi:MAG TPA: DUF6596 domain-containing protein [Bryobacteraceae bacterium]|jgi:RNA polymerase sigma-70 factor (ECF subfamily)|nr:DUF6596 domain-containing protein [Bryobacteraceae bacterium]